MTRLKNVSRAAYRKMSFPVRLGLMLLVLSFGVAYATSITLSDGEWIGGGAAKGRMTYNDLATDTLVIEDATFKAGDLEADGSATFNESGADADFRVEGDTQNDLLFADASTDFVGVRTSSPNAVLHILTSSTSTTPNGAANEFLIESNSGTNGMSFLSADAYSNLIYFGSPADKVGAQIGWKYGASGADKLFTIGTAQSGAEIQFEVADQSDAIRIDSSGNVGVGTTSPGARLDVDGSAIFNQSGADADFRVESDDFPTALAVDAADNRVEMDGFISLNPVSLLGYFPVETVGSEQVITVTHSYVGIVGVTDLDCVATPNGPPSDGTLLILHTGLSSSDVVTAINDADCSGNPGRPFRLAGDFAIGNTDTLMLIYWTIHDGAWHEISRSDN